MAQKEEAGVSARGNKDERRILELDLKTIRYTAPQHRMKKGVQKPLSVEDRFMMENM